MKICYVIAEYNPFHNGHLRQIEFIKKTLSPEKIVVIMSGNFTQRGEPAVMNKYLRAKHALLSGVDAVIELPTVFALSNAETFAKGGIKIIKSIGENDSAICFGVESGSEKEYIALAKLLNLEPKEYKTALKEELEKGSSLCKAKADAVKKINADINCDLLLSPNNILGVEYVKAILKSGLNIKIVPMLRDAGHNDKKLKKKISSAISIRQAFRFGKISSVKSVVPKCVYKDLKNLNKSQTVLEKIALYKILSESTETLKKIPDCTEGLENRIKALAVDNSDFETLVGKITTKRYTSSRIRRIIYSSILKIDSETVEKALKENLYISVLGIKEDAISLIKKNTTAPLLIRRSDEEGIQGTAKTCLNIDRLATSIFNLSNAPTPSNPIIL